MGMPLVLPRSKVHASHLIKYPPLPNGTDIHADAQIPLKT